MSLCSIVVLDFAPGTKASIYPGSNINRDKFEGSKTVSVTRLVRSTCRQSPEHTAPVIDAHVQVTRLAHMPLGSFSFQTKTFWLSNQRFDQMSRGLFGH